MSGNGSFISGCYGPLDSVSLSLLLRDASRSDILANCGEIIYVLVQYPAEQFYARVISFLGSGYAGRGMTCGPGEL